MTEVATRLSLVRQLCERALGVAAALTWLPPLFARVVVGVVFLLSGWRKLHNLDGVIEFFRGLGIPAPELQAPFAAGNELVCGVLVLVGLCTRIASIPLIVIMIVALKTAAYDPAKAEGDVLNYVFGLPEFLYIALLVWLVIYGAGAASLDRLVWGRRRAG